MTTIFTNDLIHETSPYLLQHAHNPVAWRSWGEAALAAARELDRPILLSIGYAACHWCHVMAHESFEDEETARFMNDHFVCIKVDREERPDLDQLYQTALQLLTRRGGGWPLTMFLTPAGAPFFGGTYFPPDDRHGLPSFRRVLAGVARHYQEQPAEAAADGGRVVAALGEMEAAAPRGDLDTGLVARAVEESTTHVDPVHGGVGGAPKFPQTACLTLLLRTVGRPRELALLTLDAMASGGIYDHLGGGFARYSTDELWLVPHFEKMLYDNGLLASLYLEAYQATGKRGYAGVVEGTLRYLQRDLLHPGGGFYASQDADSEGEEGRYYVWQRSEVEALLGADADPFCRCYGVSEAGNWEGKNILYLARPTGEVAAEVGMSTAALDGLLARGRERLLAARGERTPPATDTKIICSWNGMAISACSRAGICLDLDWAVAMAVESGDFLWDGCWRDGHLYRCWTDGAPRHDGVLDDYAYLGVAYLDLYEATGEGRFLARATGLGRAIVDRFYAGDGGGFYLTGGGQDPLVHRPRAGHDQSIPSGAAAACTLLLRLVPFTDDVRLGGAAEATLAHHSGSMAAQPVAYGGLLACVAPALDPPPEITLVGEPAARRDWARHLAQLHLPHRALCHLPCDPPVAGAIAAGKEAQGGKLTAYLCRHHTCSPPMTTWEELERALG